MIGRKYQNEYFASWDTIQIDLWNNNVRWLKQYKAQVINSINGQLSPI